MDEIPNPTFDQQKTKLSRQIKRRLKSARKGAEKVESQLHEAQLWQKKQQEALVLQSNLYQIPKGAKQASFQDWESNQELTFTFDHRQEPAHLVKALFRKSKKLKEGIEPLTRQLTIAKQWEQKWEKALANLELIETEQQLIELSQELELEEKTKAKDKPKPILPYREFISRTGTPIWVGKSAKDNDVLTFTYANGSNFWLHVSDYAGSHVVIRTPKGKEPDDDTVLDAAQLAIEYSKAKGKGKVEVTLTQCKFITKYKESKSGTVHLSKHKKIMVTPSKKHLDEIKNPRH